LDPRLVRDNHYRALAAAPAACVSVFERRLPAVVRRQRLAGERCGAFTATADGHEREAVIRVIRDRLQNDLRHGSRA